MRHLFLVSGVGVCLFLTLVSGLYTVVRVASTPVLEADISGVYEAADGGILSRGDRATLTLNKDNSYTQTVRLKNGESRESAGTYKVDRGGSGLWIEFFNFELIPSFREGERTDHWATSAGRTWLGRVQFCYDSDTGYCYVKKQ